MHAEITATSRVAFLVSSFDLLSQTTLTCALGVKMRQILFGDS